MSCTGMRSGRSVRAGALANPSSVASTPGPVYQGVLGEAVTMLSPSRPLTGRNPAGSMPTRCRNAVYSARIDSNTPWS